MKWFIFCAWRFVNNGKGSFAGSAHSTKGLQKVGCAYFIHLVTWFLKHPLRRSTDITYLKPCFSLQKCNFHRCYTSCLSSCLKYSLECFFSLCIIATGASLYEKECEKANVVILSKQCFMSICQLETEVVDYLKEQILFNKMIKYCMI